MLLIIQPKAYIPYKLLKQFVKQKPSLLKEDITPKNKAFASGMNLDGGSTTGAYYESKAAPSQTPRITQSLIILFLIPSVLHVSPMKTLGQFVKVRVGSRRAHEGGTLMDVIGAVRHPKFEEEPVPHADVALLKLSENLEFSKFVNLIKIYEGVKEPYAQSFVVVSGWGATRGSDTAFRDHTPDLLTSRLKVRSRHYCIDAYQLVNGFQFTEDFFCASLRNGTRDACLFDAGAPAVQQNRLMGIMSFGPERCGHEFQPAVFVKAFYFRDFVKQTISSYKTTEDLIEAMKDVDPMIIPYMKPTKETTTVLPIDYINREDITLPDERHD
ncbi:unnamed protein product [Diatraea saccharalis]|uniref:Peptidase S1 domain-containing protein n=1 Tax=Diatraea saccharalis TaxID=40085 RepID=A0A9N9RAJ1_9NEOP|nr:unnamed protein product [Diatraea saccharalis]